MTLILRDPPINTSLTTLSNLLRNSTDDVLGIHFFKNSVSISFRSEAIATRNKQIMSANSNIPLNLKVQKQVFKQMHRLLVRPLNEFITSRDILALLRLSESEAAVQIYEHESGSLQAQIDLKSQAALTNAKSALQAGIKFLNFTTGRIQTQRVQVYEQNSVQPEKLIVQSVVDAGNSAVRRCTPRRDGASQEVLLRRSLLQYRSRSGVIRTPVAAQKRNILTESVNYDDLFRLECQRGDQFYKVISRCRSSKK
ncbi:hypothetical protein SS50377_22552 [Spironucleus salmonicida]|uniref:Uncharacterized protein n=1 Tax=Spironucleus salmonicida TaxID=348837 RepID=V6LE35_9EUKA|nr:hypothetical protein SS50377_22552 [Spironucleus salmonicida]|eukprot:EST41956.1 Hypothetical protein SS50377_18261 [Spironucleus salmonicida]